MTGSGARHRVVCLPPTYWGATAISRSPLQVESSPRWQKRDTWKIQLFRFVHQVPSSVGARVLELAQDINNRVYHSYDACETSVGSCFGLMYTRRVYCSPGPRKTSSYQSATSRETQYPPSTPPASFAHRYLPQLLRWNASRDHWHVRYVSAESITFHSNNLNDGARIFDIRVYMSPPSDVK